MDFGKSLIELGETHVNCHIAYGGDGTLLDCVREHNFSGMFFPVRNYGLCDKHTENLLKLCQDSAAFTELTQTIHPLLSVSIGEFSDIAMSEITVKNVNITECLRCDVNINGKSYMENVICDGIIFSSALGSHGYFKSVTRTIFTGYAIGVGFICPTYGINNLILPLTDNISIIPRRDTNVVITADKVVHKDICVTSLDVIKIKQDNHTKVKILGYDIFCCPRCRKNRNSTIINDQYIG